MCEKFESLHLMGFESIKYLEEQEMIKDKHVDQEAIDQIRLMSIEEWEKRLTEKDRRKIYKRTQDQHKVLRRILETDLGLNTEQEIYDEMQYQKSRKVAPKYMPSLRFGKSVSAPDMSMVHSAGNPMVNSQFPTSFNNVKGEEVTPPLQKFGTTFVGESNPQPYKQPGGEYDPNNGFSGGRDGNFESYKPYGFNRYNNSNQYPEEGISRAAFSQTYTIERKKMNEISDNVDRYLSELPSNVRYQELNIDIDTEKLKDSTYYSNGSGRRGGYNSSSPRYNHGVLNELQNKIKSADDVPIEDLKLIIFLIQRTISDMKSVGRSGRGYSLSAYELRRRGFEVNPKELLDLLKRL
jgi:hypothetical protein